MKNVYICTSCKYNHRIYINKLHEESNASRIYFAIIIKLSHKSTIVSTFLIRYTRRQKWHVWISMYLLTYRRMSIYTYMRNALQHAISFLSTWKKCQNIERFSLSIFESRNLEHSKASSCLLGTFYTAILGRALAYLSRRTLDASLPRTGWGRNPWTFRVDASSRGSPCPRPAIVPPLPRAIASVHFIVLFLFLSSVVPSRKVVTRESSQWTARHSESVQDSTSTFAMLLVIGNDWQRRWHGLLSRVDSMSRRDDRKGLRRLSTDDLLTSWMVDPPGDGRVNVSPSTWTRVMSVPRASERCHPGAALSTPSTTSILGDGRATTPCASWYRRLVVLTT